MFIPPSSKEGVALWNICLYSTGWGKAIIYTFVYYFRDFVKKILMKYKDLRNLYRHIRIKGIGPYRKRKEIRIIILEVFHIHQPFVRQESVSPFDVVIEMAAITLC